MEKTPDPRMPIVIVESPYKGNVEENTAYARMALWDCLERGEAPYASHLLYTQVGVLDDSDPKQRRRGMEAGWQFMRAAELCVVYTDLGISAGMLSGMNRAAEHEVEIEFRQIEGFRAKLHAAVCDSPTTIVLDIAAPANREDRAILSRHMRERTKVAQEVIDAERVEEAAFLTPWDTFMGLLGRRKPAHVAPGRASHDTEDTYATPALAALLHQDAVARAEGLNLDGSDRRETVPVNTVNSESPAMGYTGNDGPTSDSSSSSDSGGGGGGD